MTDLAELHAFLGGPTPRAWLDCALDNLPVLLIDHANCEKKAASTALQLMYRYIDDAELLNAMSRLAREELRHFEQVLAIMAERAIAYVHVSPSRYAGELRRHVRTHEPARLIDTLVVGAFIEARSCERFAALAPRLDDRLGRFYASLLRSEARHYQHYLELAQRTAGAAVAARIEHFRALEFELIASADADFRFHSGVPA